MASTCPPTYNACAVRNLANNKCGTLCLAFENILRINDRCKCDSITSQRMSLIQFNAPNLVNRYLIFIINTPILYLDVHEF